MPKRRSKMKSVVVRPDVRIAEATMEELRDALDERTQEELARDLSELPQPAIDPGPPTMPVVPVVSTQHHQQFQSTNGSQLSSGTHIITTAAPQMMGESVPGGQKFNELLNKARSKFQTKMGSSEKVCCCHVVTAAALVGMLQLTIVVMSMASTGIILDRWRIWEQMEQSNTERRPTPEPEPEPKTVPPIVVAILNNVTTPEPISEPETWSEAFVELELAQHLGFCAVWVVSLLIYGLAFKHYKPVMVLPNLFTLIIGAILTLTVFVGLLMHITSVDAEYQSDDYEEAIFIYMTGFMLAFFLMQLIFIFVVFKFFKFLQQASTIGGGGPPQDEPGWA